MFIMTNNFAFMEEHVGGENYRMNQGYFEFKDIYLNIINMINRERHGLSVPVEPLAKVGLYNYLSMKLKYVLDIFHLQC